MWPWVGLHRQLQSEGVDVEAPGPLRGVAADRTRGLARAQGENAGRQRLTMDLPGAGGCTPAVLRCSDSRCAVTTLAAGQLAEVRAELVGVALTSCGGG